MQKPSQDITHATIAKFKDWTGGEPHPRGLGFIIQPTFPEPPQWPSQTNEARPSTRATTAIGDRQLRRLERKVDAMYDNFVAFTTGLTMSLVEAFVL